MRLAATSSPRDEGSDGLGAGGELELAELGAGGLLAPLLEHEVRDLRLQSESLRDCRSSPRERKHTLARLCTLEESRTLTSQADSLTARTSSASFSSCSSGPVGASSSSLGAVRSSSDMPARAPSTARSRQSVRASDQSHSARLRVSREWMRDGRRGSARTSPRASFAAQVLPGCCRVQSEQSRSERAAVAKRKSSTCAIRDRKDHGDCCDASQHPQRPPRCGERRDRACRTRVCAGIDCAELSGCAATPKQWLRGPAAVLRSARPRRGRAYASAETELTACVQDVQVARRCAREPRCVVNCYFR